MKLRTSHVFSLVCLTAVVVLAQAGLEGTWVTEGVSVVEAAKKAGKSLTGLAEGTRIKFKVDAKKGKVSGSITQLNTDKEYDIEDGKLTDETAKKLIRQLLEELVNWTRRLQGQTTQ